MYQLFTLLDAIIILRESDHALIPHDPANADYQHYLAWREASEDD